MCPFDDSVTHVCSTLVSSVFTCIDVQCCKYIEASENHVVHADDYDEDKLGASDTTIHHVGKIDGSCR